MNNTRIKLWIHAVPGTRRIFNRFSRFGFVACIAALVICGPAAYSAIGKESSRVEAGLRESLVKLAFLYNFARFTDWPATAFRKPASPLRFCVLGDDPFGASFDAIAAKRIRGRSIAVRRLASTRDAARCHVLFVSRSEIPRLAEILASLRGLPILTVADMADFARSGGIINLKTANSKIRFEVNLDAARLVGLRFSSRFLSLATIVSRDR